MPRVSLFRACKFHLPVCARAGCLGVVEGRNDSSRPSRQPGWSSNPLRIRVLRMGRAPPESEGTPKHSPGQGMPQSDLLVTITSPLR
jgi:hypothetical protein